VVVRLLAGATELEEEEEEEKEEEEERVSKERGAGKSGGQKRSHI